MYLGKSQIGSKERIVLLVAMGAVLNVSVVIVARRIPSRLLNILCLILNAKKTLPRKLIFSYGKLYKIFSG